MSISLGSSTISNIYLGSNTVTAAYLGATQVFGGGGVTLPSGAVLVYDFSNTTSWPGSGTYVYDLSGNGFTGSLYGTIGSGSTGALNFLSAEARLECSASAFNSALTNRQQLYVGVQYQTGSIGSYTSFAATWGDIGSAPDIGYNYFLSVTANTALDTGVQLYNFGGGGGFGYYDTSATGVFPTDSSTHTYSMMADAVSGSYKIYIDNTLQRTKTGLSNYFVYGGTSATGNGMRFGNRTGTNEQFNGNMYKVVVYNRALSDSELTTIEDWFTQ
jgi:hypothetical protein